jgi:hypothetical protein
VTYLFVVQYFTIGRRGNECAANLAINATLPDAKKQPSWYMNLSEYQLDILAQVY